jgi:hypothetical protein
MVHRGAVYRPRLITCKIAVPGRAPTSYEYRPNLIPYERAAKYLIEKETSTGSPASRFILAPRRQTVALRPKSCRGLWLAPLYYRRR